MDKSIIMDKPILSTLKPAFGSNSKKFRVGRGKGSGCGNKCGKGSNGNKQRSGYKAKHGFEGGQTPFYRRLPHIHKINKYSKNYIVAVTLDTLSFLFRKGIYVINNEVLIKNGFIKKTENYKVICGTKNEIPNNVEITASSFSKNAENLIKEKGGKCIKLVDTNISSR
jgi:large subunit ribosomal protein L15